MRRLQFNINLDRKMLYMILGIILLSVFSLTIVYAALSVTLNITGSTQITASNWDIHLENPEVKSGSVSSAVPTISGNNLSFTANLTKPGEYYEFTVDVVNDGTIDAMIDSVVKTPELTNVQAKYLKYEVSYQNNESISTKQTLKSGTSTPIKVRIEYRTDLSSSDLPSTTTNLSLKLTLLYVQSDGSGSSVKDNGEVKLINVVSGDGTKTSDEVCIGEECFYVMYSDDTTVTMLAKYNLYVGNECTSSSSSSCAAYGDEATGKQNSEMIGHGKKPRKGTTKFSNANYWTSTVSSYPAYVYDSNSTLYNYVENYKTYLSTLGVTPTEARLITYEELTALGCSGTSCKNAPSWVYATSYWSGSAGSSSTVWDVFSGGDFYNYMHSNYHYYGCRPVITISRSLIDSAGSSAAKNLIEFTITDGDGNILTYQAEEGMTWTEFVNSDYSSNRFSIEDGWGYIKYDNDWLDTCDSSSDVIISGESYIVSSYGSGLGCKDF